MNTGSNEQINSSREELTKANDRLLRTIKTLKEATEENEKNICMHIISEIGRCIKLNENKYYNLFCSQEGLTLLMHIAKLNRKYFSEKLANDMLTEDPSSINSSDMKGNTAFMYAAMYGNSDIIDVLNKIGLEHNKENKQGENAWMIAIKNKNKKFLEEMFEKRMDIPKESEQKLTTLAIKNYDPDILTLLSSKGLDFNKKIPMVKRP